MRQKIFTANLATIQSGGGLHRKRGGKSKGGGLVGDEHPRKTDDEHEMGKSMMP